MAEFTRDLILGMVAGLLTTLSVAAGNADNESHVKMRQLKTWLQKNKLPKKHQINVSEYCHELWTNRKVLNTQDLFDDIPPSMKKQLTGFLYGRLIANICLFRGLSDEVISALCDAVHPMYVMPGQEVMREGQSGRELYMILSGELEVRQGNPAKRLGFLSEGSFFGEAAVLATGSGAELRTRTVVAVVDCELCFLTSDEIRTLRSEYPELNARLNRFSNIGQLRLTKKAKDKLFQDGHSGRRASVVLAELTEEFKDMKEAVKMHSESYRVPVQELDRSTDTNESADPEEFMSMTQLRSLMMMRQKARDARSRLQMRPKRQMEASGQQQHSQRGPSTEVLPPTITEDTVSSLDARMENLEAKLDRVLLKLEG